MSDTEEIAIGNGVIVLRNGYPVGYRSTVPVSPREIRPLEKRIEERLGHPVIFLSLAPEDKYSDGDWEGQLFHPDSVLFEQDAPQFNNAPPRAPEVIGLWNGKDVADLYAVFKEKFVNLDGCSLYDMEFLHHANLVALQSRRLSKEEMKGTGLLSASYYMAYFRDHSGKSLVLVPGVNWFATCPNKEVLVSSLGVAYRNAYYGIHRSEKVREEMTQTGSSLLIDEATDELK